MRLCLSLLFVCVAGCAGPTLPKSQTLPELVAGKDIPCGTLVDNPNAMFRVGRICYRGEKPKDAPLLSPFPSDAMPGTWLRALGGKVVARALRKGEVVRLADITEEDGSAYGGPG